MDEDEKKKLESFFTLFGGIMFGDVEKVKRILDQGENVNGRFLDIGYEGPKNSDSNPAFKETDTPLLVAVKSSAQTEVIKLLLDRGADVTVRDENGKTPIDIAKERKLIDIVEMLENHKTSE
jgi:ankyrin repeat protein